MKNIRTDLLADEKGAFVPDWYYAGMNHGIRKKVNVQPQERKQSLEYYFNLPDARRIILRQDCNMGGVHTRVFVYFKGDNERYFDISRYWIHTLHTLPNGDIMDIEGRKWFVEKIDEYIYNFLLKQ